MSLEVHAVQYWAVRWDSIVHLRLPVVVSEETVPVVEAFLVEVEAQGFHTELS